MKKLFFGLILLLVITLFPVISMAGVGVHINVPLPPPLPFIAPPHVVVLPGTDVYAVPDIEEEIFFQQGWWWRHWDNRWYRSKYHDRGWAYYRGHPTWYSGIPHDWRDNYRNRVWHGHPWNYRPIPHGDLDRHWRGGYWRTDQGWEHPGERDRGPRDRDPGPRERDRGPRGHDGPGDRR
jgi:hypothetical protein